MASEAQAKEVTAEKRISGIIGEKVMCVTCWQKIIHILPVSENLWDPEIKDSGPINLA